MQGLKRLDRYLLSQLMALFGFFALVLVFSMVLMHPVCLVLSTLGGGW